VKHWKTKLSIILACQLLVAAGLWALGLQNSTHQAVQLLANLQEDNIQTIEIRSQDDSVKIISENGVWKLPDFHSLKADQDKVKNLILELKGLTALDQVTQSSSSHDRFEVSQEKANTELILSGHNSVVLAHLFLGKSPSFGKRYVRMDGEDEIYSTKWNAMGLQAQGKSWFDQSVLQPSSISELKFEEFTLTQENGLWKSGEISLDQDKAKKLTALLENLRVFDTSENEPADGFDVEVRDSNGNSLTYTFFKKDKLNFVKRSDIDTTFQLSASTLDQLQEASVEDLIKTDQESATPAEEPTPEPERKD